MDFYSRLLPSSRLRAFVVNYLASKRKTVRRALGWHAACYERFTTEARPLVISS